MSANPDRVKEPSSVPSIIVLILLILTVVSLGVAIFINLSDQAEDGRYRSLGGELRVSIQKVFSGARLAVEGDEAAFDDLVSAQKDFALTMRKLGRGDQDTSPIRQWLPGEYKSLDDTWQDVSASIDTISANQERILFLHEVAETLNESIPELQQEYNLVVDILVDSGAKSDQAVLAQRQALLGERITRNIGKMLEGGIDASGAADQFNLDASLFGSVLEGMISGNAAMRIDQVTDEEALESLAQIEELYAFVNNSVDKIFQASPDLLNTRQSVDLILDSSEQLNAEIDTLIANVDDVSAQRLMKEIYIYGIAAFVVFLMVILAVLASVNARRRLQIEEQTNENSQRAILTLLDELADLADGDLRTKATVTEEFTGAIADSINFTIDQLRILVSRITDSSLSISSASELAKSTSEELSGAADQQAKEITEATLSINEMAETIDGVSTQAAESANVANRSVDIAKNGANVVRNTIGGMDTIREQIQDTSKRIKRLGESSQEIGDIVSLINDIADQTNILSLNAAIQASMAGDAGRGFAVVADEVQRLAERSSGATKQIEALVKTIQTDTNEAVISMEQTTTEVVRGARLAQDAGVALEEIETVSSDIADLIQNISESARQQALKATVVSDRMNVIQDITSQTATGTKDTADSIGNLTSLSVAMRESVSGFSLPEELIDDDVEADLSEDAIESADLVEGDQLDPYDTVSDLGAFVDTNDSLDETVIEPVAEIVESSEFDSLDETIQIDSADGLALPEEDEVVEITDEVVEITDEVSESLDMSDEPNELDDVFDVDTALESEPEAEKIVESVTQEEASIDLEEDSIDLDFSFDDDDSFDIETEEPVEESVQAKVEEALQEVTNNDDAEADEFMLGLDEDFDLDLDDFSFDDEPQKNI